MEIILTAMMVMAAYMAIIAGTFGIPPSLSDSFYLLDERKKGLGYVFTGLCWTEAIMVAICMLELSDGMWFQFMAFLACAGLGFVGAAPLFREKSESRVHFTGAAMCAIFSQVWIILMGMWYLPVIFLAIALLAVRANGNKIFWLEMAAFASAYAAILIKLI